MPHPTPLARRVLAGATVGVLLLAANPLATAPAHAEEAPGKILLMLDASGSMNGADPGGGTKMEAAKKALTSAIGSLPQDAEVGLRVYGATQPGGKPTPEACSDTQLVHPVGKLDVAGLTAAVDGFSAKGETPIAHSLLEGAKDLGPDGKRHIILVSDGEESCSPDPCADIAAITGTGVTLQIDTVGFGVNDKAREQLRCIAQKGNGTYYDAKNSDELTSSLTKVSTRAARAFTTQGTPVTGTPAAEGAPELTAGQYLDSVTSTTQGTTERHYTVKRTIPGSTLRVSAIARMPAAETYSGGYDRGTWTFELMPVGDPETVCQEMTDRGHDTQQRGVVVSGTVVAVSLDPRATKPTERVRACAAASEFTYRITRGTGNGGGTPTELRVIEEPPVADAGALPDGVATVPGESTPVVSPASGTPVRVTGGAGFNDAEKLGPGTYEAEIVPGEMVFFATDLGFGQSATFATDGPPSQFPPANVGSSYYLNVAGDVYAPDLGRIDSRPTINGNFAVGKDGIRRFLADDLDINLVPEIRYRNRWDSPAMRDNRGFAMAGTYYFALSVAQEKRVEGVPIPIRFSIGVDGTAQPAPAPDPSAKPTARPSVEPVPVGSVPRTDEPDAGVPVAPLVGGGLIGLGVLGGLGYWLWRRRG